MVNYPHFVRRQTTPPRKKSEKNTVNFANRGMSFEAAINETNNYYLSRDIAVIYKKPTPIQIVKVDYPKRSRAKIVEAYFRQASTTDYSGVYKGYYVDFEAKETKNKTSFPLANIHKHQIKHLENITNHGGIGFIVVRFSMLNETYLLKAEDLFSFTKDNKRKSIPLDFFNKKGYLLKEKYRPRLDYLTVVEDFLEVKDNGKN